MSVPDFVISGKAADRIVKELKKRGTLDAYLRIGIKGGGCSGFSYIFQWDELKDKDLVIIAGGAKVVIDPKSYLYLKGSMLDYSLSPQSLIGGFVISNPNSDSSCGCGISFSLKK
jgi:iron-sulfur cluster assembly accessory protein